ncbi:hypothetical protein BD309DRAFT_975965 [Dichomitus squalens]|nr:hypothetical protein BD309DRAFT_975965 [Dichomitus squalens]
MHVYAPASRFSRKRIRTSNLLPNARFPINAPRARPSDTERAASIDLNLKANSLHVAEHHLSTPHLLIVLLPPAVFIFGPVRFDTDSLGLRRCRRPCVSV